MGKVLGLTKSNDLYEDMPDDLKWAIPLHEHLNSPEMQRWFAERKVQAEQRFEKEMSSLRKEASKKDLKILAPR